MSLWPRVDTFPAGSFICPECGVQNFYAIVPVGEGPEKDGAADMMEIAGYPMDVRQNCIFAKEPDAVQCSRCESTFEPNHDGPDL